MPKFSAQGNKIISDLQAKKTSVMIAVENIIKSPREGLSNHFRFCRPTIPNRTEAAIESWIAPEHLMHSKRHTGQSISQVSNSQ
jgi:hypothetical protein